MAEKSGVDWTTASWGPWRGCRKIAPGCANCYAERDMKRFGQDHSLIVRAASATFNMPLKLKEPTEIFVCPWSDFWLPEADDWREEAFEIVRRTPHTYLIPTKRPAEMADHLPADWEALSQRIWPGLSVATQADADGLLPKALQIPGQWWLSAEPLLGPLDLRMVSPAIVGHGRYGMDALNRDYAHLRGVVIGAESGPGARPCDLEWVEALVRQCDGAGIPVFVKQIHQDGKLVKMPQVLGAARDALPWRQS